MEAGLGSRPHYGEDEELAAAIAASLAGNSATVSSPALESYAAGQSSSSHSDKPPLSDPGPEPDAGQGKDAWLSPLKIVFYLFENLSKMPHCNLLYW